jgi:hypothetical protein
MYIYIYYICMYNMFHILYHIVYNIVYDMLAYHIISCHISSYHLINATDVYHIWSHHICT